MWWIGGEGVHPPGYSMGEGYGGSMRDLHSTGGKGTTKDGVTMVIDLYSPSKPYLLLSSSKMIAPRGKGEGVCVASMEGNYVKIYKT
jgi:ribosomal protein S6E (S10)